MFRNFLAGMGAGIVEAVVAVTPIDTIKTKLIESNKSTIEGVRYIVRTSGIKGIYQGVFATMLKQGSNQGLRFMFFNKYKEQMALAGVAISPLVSLAGGMLAGCFSTLLNNPIDVVKTRLQGGGSYAGTLDCFQRIATEEGLRGFYRGVIPRLGRVVPGQVSEHSSSSSSTCSMV